MDNNNLAISSPNACPKSPQSQKAPTSPCLPNHVAMNPADRFCVTVHKVIQLHCMLLMMVTGTAIGAEPGVNP